MHLVQKNKPDSRGSSPAMTLFVVRHARARPAHLPLAPDGRIKSGHDVVGESEAGSEAFAGIMMERRVMRELDARVTALRSGRWGRRRLSWPRDWRASLDPFPAP